MSSVSGTLIAMTDGWIAVGAIMTGVGSGAIAWQAVLTRRLVRATKEDLATGRQVVIEAAKNRLDSRAPQVVIDITDVAQLPLYASDFGQPQPVVGLKDLGRGIRQR